MVQLGGFERILVPVNHSRHSVTLVQMALGITCSDWEQSKLAARYRPSPPQSCAPLTRGPLDAFYLLTMRQSGTDQPDEARQLQTMLKEQPPFVDSILEDYEM